MFGSFVVGARRTVGWLTVAALWDTSYAFELFGDAKKVLLHWKCRHISERFL